MVENNVLEESLYHQRTWLKMRSIVLQKEAFEEYKTALLRLIPNASEDYIINPLLLSQILRLYVRQNNID